MPKLIRTIIDEAQEGIGPAGEWIYLLQTTKHGFKGNEFNCHVALVHAPEFAGKIARNVRSGRLELLAECPAGLPGPWRDEETVGVLLWLQDRAIPAKLAHVEAALLRVADARRYDPIRDYLDGLEWDGEERIETWLPTYCGAADTPATRLIGANFLTGTAARALNPGCRMDYALALEGPQGVKKSTVARILGGPWHSESLPDFHSRDAQQIAGTSWVIEVADLAALRRSQIEHFKAFLTTTADTYVPKYARHPVTKPRWCVFIVTVNPNGAGWLEDPTGNRRIWPVAVGSIDAARLERDRDQLLAEAVYCFRRGDSWWIETAEQRDLLHEEQEERVIEEPWSDVIGVWASRQVGQFTTVEVARGALGIDDKDIGKAEATRIGIALKKLGFSRQRVTRKEGRTWAYERQ